MAMDASLCTDERVAQATAALRALRPEDLNGDDAKELREKAEDGGGSVPGATGPRCTSGTTARSPQTEKK